MIVTRRALKHLPTFHYKLCLFTPVGAHNTEGIHGATPLEMLHALLLGVLCTSGHVFEQTGESSHLSDEMNALATMYRIWHAF
jgi:hypothetical protein